jgi:uncharacterized protein (TIGR00369 family)
MTETLTPDARAARLAEIMDRVPYIKFLGMRAEVAGDQMTAILPFSEHLIGNTMLPALHGGVLGAFLEMTGLIQLGLLNAGKLPKTIDVTIDYLRPGRALTTYARADVKKAGRRIASVHVEAWQNERASPVAVLRGHFLMASDDAV